MNIKVQANPGFKDVDRSDKRYIVMRGSAGSGKSVDTAQNYILRLMNDKGRNLVCIRRCYIPDVWGQGGFILANQYVTAEADLQGQREPDHIPGHER